MSDVQIENDVRHNQRRPVCRGFLPADQGFAATDPTLASLLAAKDKNGKPIITQEERTYYDGLNDNLKDLFNQVVQKQIVTRPEHLGNAAIASVAPAKDGAGCLQNNCVLCHTDSEIQTPEDLFSLSPKTTRNPWDT